MVDIAYGEPENLRVGDSWEWKRTLDDYPPATWTATYSLLSSAEKITITGSESGTDHLFEVAAATTATYTAGTYGLTLSVSDGTDRYTLEYGDIDVLPDLQAAVTYDARTHAKIMLDAIEATLEGKATASQLDIISTAHGSRALSRDQSILIKLRSQYQAEVDAEEQAEDIRNGLGTGRMVRVRFK